MASSSTATGAKASVATLRKRGFVAWPWPSARRARGRRLRSRRCQARMALPRFQSAAGGGVARARSTPAVTSGAVSELCDLARARRAGEALTDGSACVKLLVRARRLAAGDQLDVRDLCRLLQALVYLTNSKNGPHADVETEVVALASGCAEAFVRVAHLAGSRELAGVSWALAKLSQHSFSRSGDVIGSLAAAAVGDFESDDLAKLAWGFAHVGVTHRTLFSAISEDVLTRRGRMSPQCLSCFAWSFASVRAGSVVLLRSLADGALRQVQDLAPQGIANVAWAVAISNPDDACSAAQCRAFAEAALGRLHDFKSAEMAGLTWAMARTSACGATALLRAFELEVVPRLSGFRAQEIASMIWAFARVSVVDGAFFRCACREVLAKISNFKTRELANVAWAVATAAVKDAKLLRTIQEQAIPKFKHFTPQGIANMVWAYASARVKSSELFCIAADTAVVKIAEFKAQELSNSVWSFAAARLHARAFFQAAAAEVSSKRKSCTPENLSKVAWAFGKLVLDAPELLQVLAEEARAKLDHFRSRMCQTLSGLSQHSPSKVMASWQPSRARPCGSSLTLAPLASRVLLGPSPP